MCQVVADTVYCHRNFPSPLPPQQVLTKCLVVSVRHVFSVSFCCRLRQSKCRRVISPLFLCGSTLFESWTKASHFSAPFCTLLVMQGFRSRSCMLTPCSLLWCYALSIAKYLPTFRMRLVPCWTHWPWRLRNCHISQRRRSSWTAWL